MNKAKNLTNINYQNYTEDQPTQKKTLFTLEKGLPRKERNSLYSCREIAKKEETEEDP